MLFWISAIVKIALIVGILVSMAAILLWVERKQSAMMQDRVGPNRAGALAVASGASVGTLKDLAAAVNAGTVSAVLALGGHVDTDPNSLTGLGQLPLVLIASHDTPLAKWASVLLPAATPFESEGSFVNAAGLAQGYKRAMLPKGDAAPAWDLVAKLGRAMDLDLAYGRLKEVRAALMARVPTAHPDHKPAPAPEAPAATTNA